MLKSIIITVLIIIIKCEAFNPKYFKLNSSETYEFLINKSTEYILDFSAENVKFPPRLTVNSSNVPITAPLMIMARKRQDLLSWQLPLILEGDSRNFFYNETSRTLCHSMITKGDFPIDNPIVSISTSSEINVNFSIKLDYQSDFFIETSVEYKFAISPSEPRYYFYNFSAKSTETDSNHEMVVLEVFSDDFVCMTVSIQNATCPVFDTNKDVTFRGFYETVAMKGGITIPKYKFPHGFYAVFVAKPDDLDCLGPMTPSVTNRTKTITLTIKPTISYKDYVTAVTITLSVIGAFYFVFIVGHLIWAKRNYVPKKMEFVECQLPTTTTTSIEAIDNPDGIIEAEFIDVVAEVNRDRELRLRKTKICLSDLARKDLKYHKTKSNLYLYNVLTVALFYGLPVVQLVVTYQMVLNETGKQDLCYYNFLCAHPLGAISDFNHVFSNSGYVLFGILFLWITYRRQRTHEDPNFDKEYGIPQHYGMFYAMGVSLIMEGILSGSYHICPNRANFQFDSSFMYIMSVLCIVKLYQNRHPDINANSFATFGVLGIAVLAGMIGILQGTVYFWSSFIFIYIIACLGLSMQIYYMGVWKLERKSFRNLWNSCVYQINSKPLDIIKPTYKDRMTLLLIGNLCNWGLAFWALYKTRSNFASFLLAIFMANTLLYFFFYIIMKYLNKERVTKITWCFLIISIVCASTALYCFLNKGISWKKTPALSRHYNQNCKLMNFYDFHDIWHYLSAVGMFFTFMVLLTLDDDLTHTHRSQIIVF